MNKQHKIFILGSIILLSITIPYIAFFQGNIESISEEEENGGSEEFIDPLADEECRYPDDYFINISNVQFIEGQNSGSNNLEELNLIDNQYFGIIPEFNGTKYNFDVRFDFDIDYEIFNGYFYVQIEAPLYPSEIVKIQVNSSKGWETLYYVSNNETNINRTYIEYATQFRIFGNIDTVSKILLIDRMVFAFGQDGDIKAKTDFNIVNYSVEYAYFRGGVIQDRRDDNWWVSAGDSLYIMGQDDVPSSGVGRIIYEVRMYLNDIGDPKLDFINKIRELGITYWKHSNDIAYWQQWTYTNLWIMNWNTELYDHNKYYKGLGVEYHKDIYVNWTSDVASNPNDYINIDEDGRLYWQFKIDSNGQGGGSSNPMGSTHHMIVMKYAKSDVEVIREEIYVPQVYTVPNTPISTSASFQVRVDAESESLYYPIQSVKYQIYNSTWERVVGYHLEGSTLYGHIWWDMKYNAGIDTWYSVYLDENLNEYEFFNISKWQNGNYTTWVNVTNTQGVSTYGYYDFEINNARPEITYLTPSVYLEKVDQLYDYDIQAYIVDPELDEYDNVSIRIYKNPSSPIIDWEFMDRISTTDVWNYTIQPILYENGIYTIEIKAKDFIGYGYNSTQILIQNNPPNIEILSPSNTELIIINQSLICNITNEEAINSAQWDIVSSLDNLNWKNLTYNAFSELYEANFSLLSYLYGDWYLVINATDDKHNSSLEIKLLQFHPFLTYYIGESQLTYKSSEIIVSTSEEDSTEITAHFTLHHHPIAVEHDWEIYIPDDFSDAFDYYITRGFNTYYPEGFSNEGKYTEWHLPYGQLVDTVNLNLEKPKLTNSITGVLEREDGSYQLEFTLSAKHSFTFLTVKHQLTQYFAHPENYDYTLEYQFEGKWVDYTGNLEVDAGAFINFEFEWVSIDSNSTIEFRFTANPLEIQETNLVAWLIFGGVASSIGAVVWVLFGGFAFKKYVDWGKGKFILVSIAVIGISFAVGFGIGLLAYPNPT